MMHVGDCWFANWKLHMIGFDKFLQEMLWSAFSAVCMELVKTAQSTQISIVINAYNMRRMFPDRCVEQKRLPQDEGPQFSK